MSTNLCIPVTAGITGAACFTTVFIIMITFILGFLSGTSNMKKKLMLKEEIKSQQEVPVYEEIEPTERVDKLETLHNIAYDQVHKI